MDYFVDETELRHHGTLGMRWGIRRYQNLDGTLTDLGKKRLLKKTGEVSKFGRKHFNYLDKENKRKEIDRLVNKGDVKTLTDKKHKDDLTLNDINKAVDQAKLNIRISELAKDPKRLEKEYEAQKAIEKMTIMGNKLEKMSNVITKGSNVYNGIVRITNSFGITDMNLIKDTNKGDKKKEAEKDKPLFKNIVEFNNTDINKLTPEQAKAGAEFYKNVNIIRNYKEQQYDKAKELEKSKQKEKEPKQKEKEPFTIRNIDEQKSLKDMTFTELKEYQELIDKYDEVSELKGEFYKKKKK